MRRSWRAGADCKSVGLSLRWFESTHSHQNKKHPPNGGCFLFCDVVYGLGHTIVRLFGSEQARQRAVKGARRNFIAVGITIHPLPPKDTPHHKGAVFLWISYYSGGSKITYTKNTNFYQSSNNQDFQVFAPFESTEAVLVSNTNKLMI